MESEVSVAWAPLASTLEASLDSGGKRTSWVSRLVFAFPCQPRPYAVPDPALLPIFFSISSLRQEENCSAGGGGGDTKAHFPNPPPSLLGRRDGRGGVQGGGARPAVPGGGGVNPTSMAQNDTHVALIILTTQMWGGEGGELLVEKTFSGQILCSCAFGANIRSYTKQRARHGTPFLQPPKEL